jgi:hypothetical protein
MGTQGPQSSAAGRRSVKLDTLLWALAFTLAAMSTTPEASGDARGTVQLQALQETPLTQYRAFRRMHARHDKFNQEAWIDAWTEVDGASFKYEITSERGSDYIRNKVLRAILAREQDLINNGEAGRAEITAENYAFEEPGAQEDGFRYVLLKAKRKDMLLVNGRMVLNSQGTELLRVEGTLAKNPSFWTSCQYRPGICHGRRRSRSCVDGHDGQAQIRRPRSDGRAVRVRDGERPPGRGRASAADERASRQLMQRV